MTPTLVVLGIIFTAQSPSPGRPPDHPSNPVYSAMRSEGVTLGGTHVTFPAPLLPDGASADAEHAALRALAGSDRALAELTRDSVSAPQILKLNDVSAGDRGTIRSGDLYFVVRASTEEVDPSADDSSLAGEKKVESGNMGFSAAKVPQTDLAARGIKPAVGREWYIHLTSRLLDRIHVEATDRIVATKSDRSWVVASRTDSRFDTDRALGNRWHAITRKGGREEAGPDETYPGGASFVKFSNLASVPGAMLVEAHFAFFEPRAWFHGGPVLRSKIALVTQDRVRGLRRDLAKSRKAEGVRKTSETGAAPVDSLSWVGFLPRLDAPASRVYGWLPILSRRTQLPN